MIKQEPKVQAGAVGQEPGLTEGAEIVHLDGEVHRARDYEIAPHEGVYGHKSLPVEAGAVN